VHKLQHPEHNANPKLIRHDDVRSGVKRGSVVVSPIFNLARICSKVRSSLPHKTPFDNQ